MNVKRDIIFNTFGTSYFNPLYYLILNKNIKISPYNYIMNIINGNIRIIKGSIIV
jgi:hypothetical protein